MVNIPMIYEGDAHETLYKVKPESVHLTFTSLPYYNARDYAKYESYDRYN